MKRFITFFCISVLLLTVRAGVYGVKDVPNVQLMDSTRLVSNPDRIISPDTEAALNSLLRDTRSRTSAEVVVVMVDDIKDYEAGEFATELFQEWGLGTKGRDNGLLILVVKDTHDAQIRTGYGMEEVITDAVASRLLREKMFPRFREGNFDQGVLDVVTEINKILADPQYAEALREDSKDMSLSSFFMGWLLLGATVALALLIWLIVVARKIKGLDSYDQYKKLSALNLSFMVLSIVGLGVPFISYAVLRSSMKRVRNTPRTCPNCGAAMHKLDEDADNFYLTPAQDTEERIKSVDYDVWLCPNCNETDVLPFVNSSNNYMECPQCHGRTVSLISKRTVQRPTSHSDGRGVNSFRCNHCGHAFEKSFIIPREEVAGGVGGFGGGGGGGFGGGGFGGGSTGGGGAGGRW